MYPYHPAGSGHPNSTFKAIQEGTGTRPYTGKVGVEDSDGIDTAYRVVADQARAVTLALLDGVLPNETGPGKLLRERLKRGIGFAMYKLGGMSGIFAELFVSILGDTFRDTFRVVTKDPRFPQCLKDVINEEEAKLRKLLSTGKNLLDRIVSGLSPTQRSLPDDSAWLLHENYGIPFDLIQLMCEEKQLTVYTVGLEYRMRKKQQWYRLYAKTRLEIRRIVEVTFQRLFPNGFTQIPQHYPPPQDIPTQVDPGREVPKDTGIQSKSLDLSVSKPGNVGSEFEDDGESCPVTGKRSSRRAPKPTRSIPSTRQQSRNQNMPTVDEICEMFGVTDIHIDYTDADYANLISYKLYDKQIRPILQKENPKAPMTKLLMLLAAKWREFCSENPNLQDPEEDKSKPARTATMEDPVEEDEDEADKKSSSKKRVTRTRARKNLGSKRKGKVPTPKTKLGKRKRQSAKASASSEEPRQLRSSTNKNSRTDPPTSMITRGRGLKRGSASLPTESSHGKRLRKPSPIKIFKLLGSSNDLDPAHNPVKEEVNQEPAQPKPKKSTVKGKKRTRDPQPAHPPPLKLSKIIGPRDLIVNQGLAKIKMESDYVPPAATVKEEVKGQEERCFGDIPREAGAEAQASTAPHAMFVLEEDLALIKLESGEAMGAAGNTDADVEADPSLDTSVFAKLKECHSSEENSPEALDVVPVQTGALVDDIDYEAIIIEVMGESSFGREFLEIRRRIQAGEFLDDDCHWNSAAQFDTPK